MVARQRPKKYRAPVNRVILLFEPCPWSVGAGSNSLFYGRSFGRSRYVSVSSRTRLGPVAARSNLLGHHSISQAFFKEKWQLEFDPFSGRLSGS